MASTVIERPETLQIPYEQTVLERAKAWLQESEDGVQDVRLQALSRFEALGMPSRRLEAWKYINLRPLLSQSFVEDGACPDVDPHAFQAHCLPEETAIRLVFVNGRYSEALSSDASSVLVGRLQEVCHQDPAQVRGLLGANIDAEPDAFVALNTALFKDGAYVAVPDNEEIKPLVQVLLITTSQDPTETQMRNLFVLGKNAKARFLIQYVGLTGSMYLNNTVNQFVLDEAANAEATVVFSEGKKGWHLSNSHITLQGNACLSLSTVALGGNVNRHSISSLIQGEKAELHLNGLDVLDGATEMYHHTVTEHWVPKATSDQTYKAILDESGKSEFNSTVFVAKGADGTDSHQLHQTLLLSDDARVWTRPQLQINADDVKCAHGSAVGQLAEDQLFYLASRGLSQGLAKSLLTYGFAEEIIQRISDSKVREYLDGRVLENLHGACAVFKKELGA